MSKGTNPWVFLPLAGFVALAVLLASGLGRNPEELPSALAGKPVPEFSRPSLLNDRTVTEELLTGRWQLLNVWGTWCPTCYIEHPYLLELARSGIPIIGLDYKDEDAKARDYLAEYGNPFREVIVDADGQLGLDLGVYGAPETFLINPRGEIVLRHVGEMNQRVWDDKFAPVLQQAGEAPGWRRDPSRHSVVRPGGRAVLGRHRHLPVRQRRPAGPFSPSHRRAALPQMPEPEHRRFRCGNFPGHA